MCVAFHLRSRAIATARMGNPIGTPRVTSTCTAQRHGSARGSPTLRSAAKRNMAPTAAMLHVSSASLGSAHSFPTLRPAATRSIAPATGILHVSSDGSIITETPRASSPTRVHAGAHQYTSADLHSPTKCTPARTHLIIHLRRERIQGGLNTAPRCTDGQKPTQHAHAQTRNEPRAAR